MNDTQAIMLMRHANSDTLQARYASRVAARLSEQSQSASHDIGERLRVARELALDHARARRSTLAAANSTHHVGSGAAAVLALGGPPGPASPWWGRLAFLLPLVALVAGLILIQSQHVRAEITAAAEIDFDLLVDELPPTAYSDPGFLEFLKAPRD